MVVPVGIGKFSSKMAGRNDEGADFFQRCHPPNVPDSVRNRCLDGGEPSVHVGEFGIAYLHVGRLDFGLQSGQLVLGQLFDFGHRFLQQVGEFRHFRRAFLRSGGKVRLGLGTGGAFGGQHLFAVIGAGTVGLICAIATVADTVVDPRQG